MNPLYHIRNYRCRSVTHQLTLENKCKKQRFCSLVALDPKLRGCQRPTIQCLDDSLHLGLSGGSELRSKMVQVPWSLVPTPKNPWFNDSPSFWPTKRHRTCPWPSFLGPSILLRSDHRDLGHICCTALLQPSSKSPPPSLRISRGQKYATNGYVVW